MAQGSRPQSRAPGGFASITRQEKIALLIFFVIALAYAVWHIRNQRMERVDLGNDIGFRSSEINVEVEGAVVNPGMVKVSQGAVAADAIQAAGGFVPDANRDAVDVHQALSDGQRIVVPFEDGSSGQSQSAGSGGLMSINTAAKSDLETLPGIGEELAARIVDYRNRNGPFQKIEDIMLVDGIGQGKFDRIRRLITVGG